MHTNALAREYLETRHRSSSSGQALGFRTASSAKALRADPLRGHGLLPRTCPGR